jgi:hypothetical protein
MWAPFVFALNPGESNYINIGGCVELADPSQDSCAKMIQAQLACELAACLANCPVPAPSDGGTVDKTTYDNALKALNGCYNVADCADPPGCTIGGCQTFANAAAQCASPLMAGGPTAFCFQAGSDPMALKQLFTLACGGGSIPDAAPPPTDAGSGG